MLNKAGFTLLELLVVISILSAVLFIVFPKIPFLEDYTLNAEARRLAGLFRYLQDSASTKKIYYRIWFHPKKESLDVEYSLDGNEFKKGQEPFLKGFTFKHGIDMQDIVFSSSGKVEQGGAAVVFNPMSGAEPFNIHLKMEKRLLTISYNPYSGKVKILDGYI